MIKKYLTFSVWNDVKYWKSHYIIICSMSPVSFTVLAWKSHSQQCLTQKLSCLSGKTLITMWYTVIYYNFSTVLCVFKTIIFKPLSVEQGVGITLSHVCYNSRPREKVHLIYCLFSFRIRKNIILLLVCWQTLCLNFWTNVVFSWTSPLYLNLYKLNNFLLFSKFILIWIC